MSTCISPLTLNGWQQSIDRIEQKRDRRGLKSEPEMYPTTLEYKREKNVHIR